MVIGLTGGIASGKSTVASMLSQMGAAVIDADQIARDVVEPGEPAWQQIRDAFGSEVLQPDGRLDRPKLAQIIFHDAEARKRLNNIVHPAVRARMLAAKEAAEQRGESLIVLDIPLLFESRLERLVDKILVVYVPEEIQVARLMARDKIDRQYALTKIRSQLPLEIKKEKADAYIDNSGSLEETKAQLIRILHRWGIQVER